MITYMVVNEYIYCLMVGNKCISKVWNSFLRWNEQEH